MNKILKTTKYVVENSNHVKINKIKIKEFCKNFNKSHINHWINESPFDLKTLNEKDRLHFLLVFNSISFCYWKKPKWTMNYKDENFDGAWGMMAALRKAVENKTPILNMKYFSDISEKEFEKITKSKIRIPLFKERIKILREISSVLINKFNGDFSNLIKESNNDIIKLIDILTSNFPSFEDSSIYNGKKVYFYKRAQLLISDIFQTFDGKSYGRFNNPEELTACADYKLPMVLRRLGILEYSKELAEKIDNKTEIIKDSEEEIEIRANTIWANEFIKKELKKTIPKINSIHINDHLWLLGQIKDYKDRPYHLTRTIAY